MYLVFGIILICLGIALLAVNLFKSGNGPMSWPVAVSAMGIGIIFVFIGSSGSI